MEKNIATNTVQKKSLFSWFKFNKKNNSKLPNSKLPNSAIPNSANSIIYTIMVIILLGLNIYLFIELLKISLRVDAVKYYTEKPKIPFDNANENKSPIINYTKRIS